MRRAVLLVALAAVASGALIPTIALAASQSVQLATITPQELKGLIDKGKAPVIIDVRPADEIAAVGKIPGATVVSLDDFMIKNDYLPKSKNAAIVVYSTDERTASMAALALTQLLGYSNVKVLKGGFNAWDSLGYPAEEWHQPKAAPIPGGC